MSNESIWSAAGRPVVLSRLALGLLVAALWTATWPGSAGAAGVATGLSAANVPDLSAVEPIAPKAPAGQALLVIHYHRPDGDYRDWNVWAWPDGAEGREYPFEGEDAFGKVAVIALPAETPRGNFIIRKGQWLEKDVAQDRSVAMGPDRVAEVWLISGDPRVYTDPEQIDFAVRLRAAFLDDWRQIRVALTRPVDVAAVLPASVTFSVGGEAVAVASVQPASGEARAGARRLDVMLAEPVPAEAMSQPMTLALPGLEPAPVTPRDVLMTEAFTAWDAELGPTYASEATTFRTWSPVSSRVELLLYDTAEPMEPVRTIELSREARGVWEATVAGDLAGVYYQYRFHRLGEVVTVPDIHAFAATADSLKSMVVDLDRTDPPGFDTHALPRLPQPTDEVIYEIHVRDYSVHDPAVPEAHRGRYLGLTHASPADRHPAGVSTSLTHLKDLGVTAVHLMPIQDFSSDRHEYNWGYWTILFNVPESQYATTPGDPANTIRELKQTIQTLHEHDVRVILDVVYNHTAITGHPNPYEAAMPAYFFRTTDTGDFRNDAGTGNAVADERPMVRKFILDSLAYWTREYRVDGYRFDLVGTHHPETVRAIVERLRSIRPDLTLYGEPWTGGGPILFGKGAQRGLSFAVFNDHFRNAVRGDLDGTATGFATGPGGNVHDIRRGLAGAIDDFADHPLEVINYVSAHDNRTFWDKLVHTHPRAGDAERLAMHRLAHGMVLTAQGIAFVHGGADFARTKGGNHNSYNAGDAVNAFDWPRKAQFLETHRYLAGLIELRRAHPAFRLAHRDQVRQHLRFLDASPAGVVAFTLDGAAVGDPWRRILVAFNGEPTARRLDLPAGTWTVVVNHKQAGTTPLGQARTQVTLPPYAMWVGYQD